MAAGDMRPRRLAIVSDGSLNDIRQFKDKAGPTGIFGTDASPVGFNGQTAKSQPQPLALISPRLRASA